MKPIQYNLKSIPQVSLKYKSQIKAADRFQVHISGDLFKVLRSSWDEDKIEHCEEFKVVLLNRANRVLGVAIISQGGVSGTVADPKIIFQAALLANASSIALAHNHPSGNLSPSQCDLALTKKVKAAGHLLDITVIDHIILTSSESEYTSLADMGHM